MTTGNRQFLLVGPGQKVSRTIGPCGGRSLERTTADFGPGRFCSMQSSEPFRSGSVRIGPHIAYMADTFPPKYELTTKPCTIHAGRYRWVITANGKPVSTSGDSFETPELAHMDGLIAFERLVQSSRISE